jgi:hypothetical protein
MKALWPLRKVLINQPSASDEALTNGLNGQWGVKLFTNPLASPNAVPNMGVFRGSEVLRTGLDSAREHLIFFAWLRQ